VSHQKDFTTFQNTISDLMYLHNSVNDIGSSGCKMHLVDTTFQQLGYSRWLLERGS
jgi:hypothetical protein